jgi:hypothetical protein
MPGEVRSSDVCRLTVSNSERDVKLAQLGLELNADLRDSQVLLVLLPLLPLPLLPLPLLLTSLADWFTDGATIPLSHTHTHLTPPLPLLPPAFGRGRATLPRRA